MIGEVFVSRTAVGSVYVGNLKAAGSLVQVVNVLSDYEDALTLFFERCQNRMCSVWPRSGNQASAVVVPLPYCFGILLKGLKRCQLRGIVGAPITTLATESRDSTLR